jgi:GTP-binding protein
MFIDEAEIIVRSGKGGDGMVHFRREKYINRGGPDGGDGGRGGSIILKANHHLNTLEKFRHQSRFIAEDGKRGGAKNQTGKSADNLVIDLPPGTLVYDSSSGELIADLVKDDQEIVICPAGRGGLGNTKFANSRIQAPKIAERGEPGKEKNLKFELKLIADIGIIGMPNAGKSSLLAAVTNAKPKIADYPFTTLVPNLGVTVLDQKTSLVLADIPGLIEGAHTGLGLGDTFLRHIQRTRVLIHLIDGLSKDPLADYSQINSELSLFDPELDKKSQVVVINKIDLPEVGERISEITRIFKEKGVSLLFISALTRKDLEPVLWKAKQNLDKAEVSNVNLEMPIYHPKSKDRPFLIKKENEGWRIEGAAIERAAAMTFWEYFASVRRFHRILVAMGIEEALREKGVVDGDTVFIGDHELVWAQEWEDDEE